MSFDFDFNTNNPNIFIDLELESNEKFAIRNNLPFFIRLTSFKSNFQKEMCRKCNERSFYKFFI